MVHANVIFIREHAGQLFEYMFMSILFPRIISNSETLIKCFTQDHNSYRISNCLVLGRPSYSCNNMGLINKVDMVCLSPVGYGV